MRLSLFSPTSDSNVGRVLWSAVILTTTGVLVTFAEPDLFLFLNRLCSHFPDLWWVALSMLGNGWVIAALLLPFVPRHPQLFFAALMTAPWTGLVADLAKRLFATPRPAGVLDASSFHLIGEVHLQSAMPSGHTMTAFAIVIALIRMPGSPFAQHTWKLLGLAACVGVSRIGMGVHWPEDVLVGAAIGCLSGLLAVSATRALIPVNWLTLSPDVTTRTQGIRAAAIWSLIALLPALALFFLDEDRGLAPWLRLALAFFALFWSLRFFYIAWQRYRIR